MNLEYVIQSCIDDIGRYEEYEKTKEKIIIAASQNAATPPITIKTLCQIFKF